MGKTIIYNGVIVCDGTTKINNGYVLFDENGILDIGSNYSQLIKANDIDKHDAMGNWVTPGFIDIHNHGGYGYDFAKVGSDEINYVGKTMISEGLTGFLASTAVDTKEEMAAMAKRIGTYQYEKGARCLGIHMEGPFMSAKYKALMSEECLRDPDINEYRNWQSLSNNFVKVITLAPERAGSLEFISEVKDEVAVMIGHSDASVEDVFKACKVGMKGMTHFYNAMSAHLHREPGVVTAGFLEDSLLCELVGDGVHVHKDVIRMTYKIMGPNRLILITDSMCGKGMPNGEFEFCGRRIVKESDHVHVYGDVRIAGSIASFNEICANIYKWCNCEITDIVQMASTNPAKLISEDKRGKLQVGNHSDIVVFNPEFKPLKVFVGGKSLLS